MFSNAMVSADDVVNVKADDVGLAVLPLFHAFGQTTMLNLCTYKGATMTLMPRFEPRKALDVMSRDKVTFFCGVPTMYSFLLRYPHADRYDLSSLRRCISGGAAMPVEIMRAFNEKYNVTILEGYGLSETAPVATFNHMVRPPKPGSIGTALWGVEVRVVDEDDRVVPTGEVGELVIRGHNVMKGYYKSPEVTAEVMRNGWFHTGDMAKMDEDSYVFIVDRKKDMIIRAGMNIYPREVEEVLYGHPAVAEAAVVGIAHSVQGEKVHAVIVLKEEQTATEEELIHYCKERLADYKTPRTVEFRDELPKTATGKILKRQLVGDGN
jgi:long-chain acyl-CoA synthetase